MVEVPRWREESTLAVISARASASRQQTCRGSSSTAMNVGGEGQVDGRQVVKGGVVR